MSYSRDFVDYSNQFESQLLKVPHYKRFPQMMPWVGSQYAQQQKKILIVGESHYLPEGSTIQENPETWYQSSIEDLSIDPIEKQSEIVYSETAEIVSGGMKNWNNEGHKFYRLVHHAMREAGIESDSGPNDNLFRYMSFYNFFQRPAAISGGSLERTDLDDTVAYDTFESVIEILDPDAVFFVSVKVWDALMNQYYKISDPIKYKRRLIRTKSKEVACGFSPHTAAFGIWYKTYPGYENTLSGQEEFIDFLKEYYL